MLRLSYGYRATGFLFCLFPDVERSTSKQRHDVPGNSNRTSDVTVLRACQSLVAKLMFQLSMSKDVLIVWH